MTPSILRADSRSLPLPDASVDLVVTSPPYFALRSYTDGGEHYEGQLGSEATPAEYIANLLDCTREWVRVLKPSGSIWVNLGDAFSKGVRYDSVFTAHDAAWLAGVLDSDGSISIRVDNAGRSHIAWTRVGQMRPEVVQRIGEVTGVGQVYQDKRGVWNWNAAAQQARWVLERVWPWLRIKQRQALAAIDLMTQKTDGQRKGKWNPLTDADLSRRELIRQAVLAWNRGEEFADYDAPAVALPRLPAEPLFIPAKSLLGLPWRYALACVDELGLILRAEVIWAKPNGLPESVTDRVRRSHETWFHFTVQPRYFSAVDEIREGYAPGTAARYATGYGVAKRAAAGATSSGTLRSIAAGADCGPTGTNPLGKLPGSVWEIATEPLTVPDHLGVDHFAAFPTEWPRRIIAGWSPAGICTACGEGRRPIAAPTGERGRMPGGLSREDKRTYANLSTAALVVREITGYACACTPRTSHRGERDWREGREASAEHRTHHGGQHSAVPRRPGGFGTKTPLSPGEWEYHLDGWTPPPTRPAVVLDPFGGTGTTALVASALGRHGISVDRSADYCRIAQWRVNDPGQRASAMQVDKPEPVHRDQLELEWEMTA